MSEVHSKSARSESTRQNTSRPLRGIDAVRLAKGYLQEFTGKSCEQASGLATTEEGWVIVLEVVELERIPNTTDILGSYVVTLDHEGELVGYERARRYYRCQVQKEPSDYGGEA